MGHIDVFKLMLKNRIQPRGADRVSIPSMLLEDILGAAFDGSKTQRKVVIDRLVFRVPKHGLLVLRWRWGDVLYRH